MARADVGICQAATSSLMHSGGGVNHLVKTATAWYLIYLDQQSDVMFRKSTNDGLTWSGPTTISTGTATAIAVWYRPWSGLAGGLIHVVYNESGVDDVLQRTIDTASSDALGTETVVFAGTTSVSGSGYLAVTCARGGNVIVAYDIDGGTERGCAKSTDSGATWAAILDVGEGGADDMVLLGPGFAADNQDVLCIFWDASANEVSRKVYDDSLDTWTETSIAGSMTDLVPSSGWPNFAIAPDLTNSVLALVAWSAVDTANADLMCWTISEAAITAKTDVITNSTDDQGLCGITINTATEAWTVAYAGKSDGSETWGTAVNLYTKTSTDRGTTWGSETLVSTAVEEDLDMLMVAPRSTTPLVSVVLVNRANNEADELRANVELPSGGVAATGRARSRLLLGAF